MRDIITNHATNFLFHRELQLHSNLPVSHDIFYISFVRRSYQICPWRIWVDKRPQFQLKTLSYCKSVHVWAGFSSNLKLPAIFFSRTVTREAYVILLCLLPTYTISKSSSHTTVSQTTFEEEIWIVYHQPTFSLCLACQKSSRISVDFSAGVHERKFLFTEIIHNQLS